MKKIFIAAAAAVALCALAGCYIGKAEFKGEDMKMGATGSDMVATVDCHSSGGGLRTYEGRTPLVE